MRTPRSNKTITMDTALQLHSFRAAGIALLAIAILFMIGASTAAYFRRFPLPTDPLDQLTLIANDRVGWTAQAIIFPLMLSGRCGRLRLDGDTAAGRMAALAGHCCHGAERRRAAALAADQHRPAATRRTRRRR